MQRNNYNLHFRFSAPLSRAVASSWSWWTGELRGMLPPRARHILMPRARRLFLELDGTDVVISHDTEHHREELARYALDHTGAVSPLRAGGDELTLHARELVLCMPGDKILTRTLTLPLAAEENLREVLSFEMDHQTPFTAEQVYYDCSVVGRSAAERTLAVELVLTTRPVLDELLSRLAGLGLHPDLVTLNCNEGGDLAAVNLLPVKQRQRKVALPRLVNLALGALALLLLLGTVTLPLLDKHRRIQALEPVLETASVKAEEAHRLRMEVDQLTASSRFLADKKRSSLPVLQVLDELTRILPDDTWITRLDIKGSELQIQGQSSSAAALIPLIESSDMLQNPRFRSPVTQVPRTDSERFHLSAETRGATP